MVQSMVQSPENPWLKHGKTECIAVLCSLSENLNLLIFEYEKS